MIGELVLTSLTKEALPMIRYRTRDLTRLLPPTARSMRRIQKIIGRSDDMLIIRGVNVYPSQIESLLLQISNLAPHYLLEVARAGNLDTLTVHVELAMGASAAIGPPAAAQLQKLIKSHVGVSVKVEIGACNSIVRSHGKARHVIDKRRRE